MNSKYNTAVLISEEYSRDDIGQEIATQTRTEIFCEIASTTQSEFAAAGQNGFKPEGKVIIWEAEYDGERLIEIEGRRFSVYRTFVRADGKIELYIEGRSGNE